MIVTSVGSGEISSSTFVRVFVPYVQKRKVRIRKKSILQVGWPAVTGLPPTQGVDRGVFKRSHQLCDKINK